MMRPVLALSVAACAAAMHTTSAFTCPSASSSIATGPGPRRIALAVEGPRSAVAPSALFARDQRDDFDGLVPSLKFAKENAPPNKRSPSSVRGRIQRAGLRVWERMDTLRAAGLCEDGAAPMQSGFKSSVGLFVGAMLFKWYRARFITKIPIWDRQPQWNMVVTCPEHEKELHAYECKNCGSTIFIARHREWFFKGGNTECTNCGATGKENFVNIRDDILDSIDDDYFDYESPLDFVSAAERRKLVKQAGGDEELAKKIAIDNVMKSDKTQIQTDGEGSEGDGGDDAAKPKKKAKKESSSKESSPKKNKKEEPEDIFEELDMDL